ncbi:beta-glucosidase BglX [Parvularcula flava]|uniref:Beta-D-glucoside glucohydrolase n=1 Tax=Aquisalinus luteolus TaxID=1566827 RepID=A0A8J3ESE3_9PROT|nr:beta-glucosidase BglX [Aquisalinus luteolus]NHK28915.1 beta-glucosidase BglX [Aquisalinus luteolus]GGI00872.1 beta-glucosidase [Aquisalinus luteolus]
MIKQFLAGLAVLAGTSPVALMAQDDIEGQIDALLAEMTLEEKVGQLTQYSSFWDATGPAPQGGEQEEKFEQVREGRVGSMLNVVGRDEVRAVQELAVEDSRLGIPLIFGYDVVHGHKTIFPIPLAESASWDIDLIEQSARIAAVEAAAQGLNWTFAPMVDISRDPRWGRVMEGAGEDPYLGARIAVARVKGFQGDDLSADDTIAATIKHLAGYGFAEGGRDYNTADFGTVTLHNVILPPFKAAVEEADVRTAMNSFNILNGVPATGDAYLQRDLLKEAWGFDGFIVSDWASGREMIDHGFAAGPRDAAELAIEAGSDMDMESYIYRDHLAGLVESGAVDMAIVDDAVRRVLRVKHELGLFKDPYRYVDDPDQEDILMSPDHRAVALDVAKNSIVLLKNKASLLPLKGGEKVALIGALAADKDTPLGNWRAAGETGTAVSVVEGFEAAGVSFTYREGAAVEVGEAGFPQPVVVNTTDRSGFDAAVAAARKADKVVLVLGEDGLQSGEGRSRSDIGLPGVQQELLEAVHAANPETVLVVMSGRPLILDWADANVPAIVQAWHLGHESGHAITSVLTGDHNPGGKLPMSFPRSVGQIPVYYNYMMTGRPGPLENEVFWSHYNDLPNTPLYAFGHGLSYTGFNYSGLEITQGGRSVTVSVTLENTGDVAGTEVAQLYLRDPVASVVRPVRELKGFEKVMLEPGESTLVTFELTDAELGFYDPYGNFKVENGDFEVYVGGSSAADLGGSFTWSSN